MRVATAFRQIRTSLVAAMVSACLAAGAQAPASDEAPATAFGGGRMVRGTVTAVAPDRLTVKTEAGDTFQISVTPNTQVRKGRDPLKFAEVKAGDGVGAMGEIDRPNKTVHALVLQVITAEQIKKAKEDLGKTYIVGKVTAIDEVKLTIQRSDGVSQVIQVDEGTSFKRGGRGMAMAMGGGVAMGEFGGRSQGATTGTGQGNPSRPSNGANAGESITLADIKVGEMVVGTGALKNGVFTPTELNVADPAARAQRRRQGDAADNSAANLPKAHPQP